MYRREGKAAILAVAHEYDGPPRTPRERARQDRIYQHEAGAERARVVLACLGLACAVVVALWLWGAAGLGGSSCPDEIAADLGQCDPERLPGEPWWCWRMRLALAEGARPEGVWSRAIELPQDAVVSVEPLCLAVDHSWRVPGQWSR